jgi:hypothetical protein
MHHYDFNEILESATPMAGYNPGDYWKEATVVLEKGDTAYAPGTTKKILAGEGFIHYYISATGWFVFGSDDRIYVQHNKEIVRNT